MKSKPLNQIYIEFYCAGNFGDDLLVSNFIINTNFDVYYILTPGIDRMADAAISILISINSISKLLRNYNKNVVFLKISDFWKLKKSAENDFFTKIGGSIWYEKDLENHYDKFKKIKNKGYKIIVTSTNFSKYSHKKSVKVLSEIVSLCHYFAVRDSYSKKIVGKKIDFYHDSIYSFPIKDFINESDNVPINQCEEFLLVSLTTPNNNSNYDFDKNKYDEIVRDIIVDFIEKNNDNSGKVIKMICMQNKKDYFIINNFINKYLKKYKDSIEVIMYFDPIEMFGFFNRATKILATRFHSVVLSNLLQKNTLSIPYAPKVENHLVDINNKLDFISLSDKEFKSISESSSIQFFKINDVLKNKF